MRTESLARIVRRALPFKVAVMVLAGAALVGGVNSPVQSADERLSLAPSAAASVGDGIPSAMAQPIVDTGARGWLIEFARRDPRGLLRLAREHCQRATGDFSCLFVKQERINGTLKPVEEIDARYRADPLSVFMTWRRGADQAQRALFIDSQEFVDRQGQRLARVEPAGVLLRLFVSDVMVPIHDARAREVTASRAQTSSSSSRRTERCRARR